VWISSGSGIVTTSPAPFTTSIIRPVVPILPAFIAFTASLKIIWLLFMVFSPFLFWPVCVGLFALSDYNIPPMTVYVNTFLPPMTARVCGVSCLWSP
jgi:hypothetical protein